MVVVMLSAAMAVAADLRGHGGPVRAIAILGPDKAVTASFDTTLIRWDLARGTANGVLRFHEGAANVVIGLPDGRLASAGEDRRIALWPATGDRPSQVLEGHEGPVAGLTVSPDGATLASAGWDGTVRLWPLAGGKSTRLEGHRGNVNAVLFLGDGTLVSAGYDGTLRFWRGGQSLQVIELGLPLNALVRAGNELVAAGADGALHIVDPATGQIERVAIAETPLVALAASPSGETIGTAGFRGALALVDRPSRRITRRMAGPAFPLWSLAFSGDGREIFTGGADRLVRRWHVTTGEPVNPVLVEATDRVLNRFAQHPGAEVYKACVACHTLDADDGNRAGPTLHRIFGRKVGTAPGYSYSPALIGKPIIWSRESVGKLFEHGPNAMLPGTKMPEQVVGNASDREALLDFLEQATR